MAKRHVTAKTTVEVFRLFKIRDLGEALSRSADGVVSCIGRQITHGAVEMLRPYCQEQQAIINRHKAKR